MDYKGQSRAPEQPLMTVNDAASYLNVSSKTIRRMACELGGMKVGGQLRFTREGINAYLLTCTLAPSSPTRRRMR